MLFIVVVVVVVVVCVSIYHFSQRQLYKSGQGATSKVIQSIGVDRKKGIFCGVLSVFVLDVETDVSSFMAVDHDWCQEDPSGTDR